MLQCCGEKCISTATGSSTTTLFCSSVSSLTRYKKWPLITRGEHPNTLFHSQKPVWHSWSTWQVCQCHPPTLSFVISWREHQNCRLSSSETVHVSMLMHSFSALRLHACPCCEFLIYVGFRQCPALTCGAFRTICRHCLNCSCPLSWVTSSQKRYLKTVPTSPTLTVLYHGGALTTGKLSGPSIHGYSWAHRLRHVSEWTNPVSSCDTCIARKGNSNSTKILQYHRIVGSREEMFDRWRFKPSKLRVSWVHKIYLCFTRCTTVICVQFSNNRFLSYDKSWKYVTMWNKVFMTTSKMKMRTLCSFSKSPVSSWSQFETQHGAMESTSNFDTLCWMQEHLRQLH